MGLIDRLLGRARPPVKRPAKGRSPRTVPSPADRVPATAETLVLYGLDDVEAAPAPGVDSLVLLDFDPVDVAHLFDAPEAPACRVAEPSALLARLDGRLDGVRDPNSRGRVHFARRWLDDVRPMYVGWRLEPAAIAGDGTAGSTG